MHRAEGASKILGVFRVKNHDFTPKNHIFSNFRGGGAPGAPPPPGSAPGTYVSYILRDFHFIPYILFFTEIGCNYYVSKNDKIKVINFWGLGLWCLTPLSTIFQLYRGGQFYLFVEEIEVPGENHRLSQVTEKHNNIMVYRVHLALTRIRTHNVSDDKYWLHRYLVVNPTTIRSWPLYWLKI